MASNFTKNVISAINIKDVKYNIKAVPFHATEAEWNSISYIPKQGEFIVYDVDSNNTSPRFKTGDGVTDVKNLPFTLATISEVQTYVNSQIGSAGHLKRVVLEDGVELPDVSEANIDTIYMKKNSGSRLVSDVFDEYMVINGKWEIIGNTRVDLSSYTTQEMVDEKIETAISSIDFPEEIYKQNEPPADAEEGALWLDMDEKAAVSGGSGGGGVSSWNDLTDKPFELVEVLPETQCAYMEGEGFFMGQTGFILVPGRKYTVNWNGVEYTTTAEYGQFPFGESSVGVYFAGNPVLIGGEDNGLPFGLANMLMNGGFIGAIPLDGSTSVTVSVKSSSFYEIPDTLLLGSYYDNANGEIGAVYATPEQIEQAFFAGKRIVAIDFNGGFLQMQLVHYAPRAMTTDGSSVIAFHIPTATGVLYRSMRYNNDGTYVTYSD